MKPSTDCSKCPTTEDNQKVSHQYEQYKFCCDKLTGVDPEKAKGTTEVLPGQGGISLEVADEDVI